MNIINCQHNHKAIVAANIVLCTCSIAAYLNKFQHNMLRCMLHCWDNSPKAYSKCSVLDLACESTFWLIPSLPQCLSWLWMLSVLSSTSCDNPLLSLESFVITEPIITELSFKFEILSMNMDIIIRSRGGGGGGGGGTRYCEVTNPLVISLPKPKGGGHFTHWCRV